MRPIPCSNFAALAAILLWAVMSSRAEAAPPPPPESVVAVFVDAWNTHDREAFGKLFAADADWMTASGLRLRGRDRIQAYLAEEHAGWAKRTRMKATNVHVRVLANDSVSVMFEWEITDSADGPGAASQRRLGNNFFVVARTDTGWIIVAGQVARKP